MHQDLTPPPPAQPQGTLPLFNLSTYGSNLILAEIVDYIVQDEHFSTLDAIYPLGILSTLLSSSCHFVNLSFHHLVISSSCHFVNLSFHQLFILSTCQFVNMSFHQFVNMPFHQLVILPTCHFISLSF